MDMLDNLRAAYKIEAFGLPTLNQILHRGLLVRHWFELVVDFLHLGQMLIGQFDALWSRVDSENTFEAQSCKALTEQACPAPDIYCIDLGEGLWISLTWLL